MVSRAKGFWLQTLQFYSSDNKRRMWQEQKSIFLFSIYAVEHMTKCHQEATGGNTNAKQREQTRKEQQCGVGDTQ